MALKKHRPAARRIGFGRASTVARALAVDAVDEGTDDLRKAVHGAQLITNGLDISKCVVVLVGNRADLKKKDVKTEVAKEWAKGRGYQLFECSAKTGSNVNEAFKCLFDAIYTKSIEIRSKYLY